MRGCRCISLALALMLPDAALLTVARAAPESLATPRVTVLAEQRVTLADATSSGSSSVAVGYQFVPMGSVAQGEIIYYTVRIENPGASVLRDVEVTTPIPRNTSYVKGTAVVTGGTVTVSADGRQFMPEGRLTTPDGAVVLAARYTHLRWRLPYPLTPGAVVLARFQAVFR